MTDDDFTAFVAERAHAMLRAAYALTGNQQAAEDLVQTAFAKAYTHWRRIRGAPEPYVRRIIYHDFVSLWRHQRRRREVSVAEPPDAPTADDAGDDADLRILMRHALDQLPPRQLAVIVLRYFEDRSTADIADILGCRVGTVASQASRALDKLRLLVPEFDRAHVRQPVRREETS
jgi:RNA polymerase sigma-70 factor (sigma-E family)